MRTVFYTWIGLAALGGCFSAAGQRISEADPTSVNKIEQAESLFFDALMQKAIENYDRSVQLLLDADRLAPDQPELQHELAKVYLLDKQMEWSRRHALIAIQLDARQYWYIDTYMQSLHDGEEPQELFKVLEGDRGAEVKRNLARWYLNQDQPDEALEVLSTLKEDLQVKVLRLRAMRVHHPTMESAVGRDAGGTQDAGWSVIYAQMKQLIAREDWNLVYDNATENLERYPLQPFLYFAAGKALFAQNEVSEARDLLETGEALLVQEDETSREIYALLAQIHRSLGNEGLSRMYLNKLN